LSAAPLTLYYHPLSSFCWKVLIALYENGTPFVPLQVDLGDQSTRDAFAQVWPMARFPVLRDDARDITVPESGVIIEYLALHYPGAVPLMPTDPDLAREARLQERFIDLYIHQPMQKLAADGRRPEDGRDPLGVADARRTMRTAYDILDARMAEREWCVDDRFGLADCAAAPALYYASRLEPLQAHPHVAAYLERLHARPSFARVFEEAQPWLRKFWP
jgi:glutathione S-transferase